MERGMELIPAIDLLGGRVVRLRQGDYAQATDYADDPIGVARRWVAEGAGRLHIVDLDGAREGRRVQASLVEAVVRAAGVPCQVAGGFRDAASVAAALDAGADRVVLGSALIEEPGLAADLLARYGSERLVAAIDVRDGQAVGDGWVGGSKRVDAGALARGLAETGMSWFAVTSIVRDGLLAGPDLGLLRRIRDDVPHARIICSGGVTTLTDVRALAEHGFAAAILGRALYEGRLSLREALSAL
jgi:phosphoribosylformimino-5-aminoimidazole carboxamide ribotide isomerase